MRSVNAIMRFMKSIACSIACGLALPWLVSCSSSGPDALRARAGGLVAELGSPSSSVTGVVHVYDTRDGVQVQLSINNLYPGQYRIAFHANPNCRSPNLFSAGPPWAPPGFPTPANDILPGFLANVDGNQNGYVAFVTGLHTERPPSLQGRSVVIHWGNVVGEAIPGSPNNRIACGILKWTEGAF